MTNIIQLSRKWALGSQLGQGGFGRVLEGVDEDGNLTAIKFIPKEPGADRELLFENLSGIRNIVPIIDAGEYDDYWVLVMPRATKTLREHLKANNTLPYEEVIKIIKDVTTALSDIQGQVVHRDIKPENVLLLDGHWCLADFGISRYAESSTSADTHKWAWTLPYNPPERWRGDRATPASDIYSLGIMAFEMLIGRWPFQGPDFRNQHMTQDPPSVTNAPRLLASLIAECLLKSPNARPTAENILTRLERMSQPSSSGAALLQMANHEFVQNIAKKESIQSSKKSLQDMQSELLVSSRKIFLMIAENLMENIRDNAPSAIWQHKAPDSGGFSVRLESATLTLSPVEVARNEWKNYTPKIKVIAYSNINLHIPPDHIFQYEGRQHSLWYCDAQEEGIFKWYETAFVISPLLNKRGKQNPFSLPPQGDTGQALCPVMGQFDVAWPFTPIEPGNDLDFVDRWLTWFAQAAQGNLDYQRSLQSPPVNGSWRQ